MSLLHELVLRYTTFLIKGEKRECAYSRWSDWFLHEENHTKKRINMDKITAFPYLADMVCRVTDHRSHLATIGVDIISIISKIHWYDTFLEYRSPGMLTVGRKSKDLNMIAKIQRNGHYNTQRNTTDINDSVQHHNETQQTSMTVYNITTKHNIEWNKVSRIMNISCRYSIPNEGAICSNRWHRNSPLIRDL